jgi:hypothetical protein
VSVNTLKVIEWSRKLFPELASSLEKDGQITPVLRDEQGITIDGIKREILLGKEQVQFKTVPKDSATNNIHHLNKNQRKAVVKYKYEQLSKIHGSMESKKTIALHYGISLRTIERDLNSDVASNVATSKLSKQRLYKDTATWNPFVGCGYDCNYCKPSFQENHYFVIQHRNCGLYRPHIHPERLDVNKIPHEKTIFVCGDSDVSFCKPEDFRRILEVMKQDKMRDRLWFIQSKYPEYFSQFLAYLPKNTILLTTLETNRDTNYSSISKAPPPSDRYKQFLNLNYPNKIVTIEPLMDFDIEIFPEWILSLKPMAVFIGYNSHPSQVPLEETPMEKCLDLIVTLKNKGIRVLTKELRKMAYRDF